MGTGIVGEFAGGANEAEITNDMPNRKKIP